jgi:hypothetical protein
MSVALVFRFDLGNLWWYALVCSATYVLGPTPFVVIGDRQGRMSVLTYPVGGNRATASLLGTVSRYFGMRKSCVSD